MSYFIYFHIDSGFWYFLLPVLLHIMLINIVLPVKDFMLKSGKRFSRFMANLLYAVTYWGFPAFALVLFYQKYKLFGLIIPAAILWYLILLINITSIKLYQENININRLTGRFRGIRKGFYKLVKAIPLIGKKRVPFKALKGVSFTIENGMFGLLGPNGAGKSTLMRIICGVLEASYGQITINGIDVKEKREELQGLIGYLPQEFGMYEHLTALDFLHYMGILKKIRNTQVRNERVEYVLKAVHMYEHRNEKIGSFSGGMKQRIGIAQILLHLPRILVVDEPTAGLDPRERIRFRNLLVELSKERIVIFSTHIIEDVASSCSQVAVIRQGELNYLGAPVDMARIADGKVWSIDMTTDEFELFRDNFVILHHMRDGDLIRVRCLAEEAPAEKATQVKANLEDDYLYLLNKYTS
jgi:ABC-type multidrug transport system ATPase subunit